MISTLTIGSRGSKLALTQTNHIADAIRRLRPGLEVRIEIIKTTGDRILDAPLAKIGGKGLFTKELEVAMIDRLIDLAVHSMKDLPTELPEGLCIGAVPPRVTPNDALVCSKFESIESLPAGARVGTSSLRRIAQLRAVRPDLNIVDLRGNVDTRIGKVADGELDAAILACAGLQRIGRADAIRQVISEDVMISAAAQGALGLEIREDDEDLKAILAELNDLASAREVEAERTLLGALGGGCQVPIGARASVEGGNLHLLACVCSLDGNTLIRTSRMGSVDNPHELGMRVASELLQRGADAIVASIR